MTSWSRGSRSNFLDHDGRLYFVVRTWWGRRVWADLTGRAVVSDPAPDLVAAADESDRVFVMETLPGAMVRLNSLHAKGAGDEYWEQVRLVEAAIDLAGRLGVGAAIEHLHGLSDSEYESGSGRGCPHGYSWRVYSMRQRAHLALRRLGEVPRCQPCMRLIDISGQRDEGAGPLPVARASRAGEVIAGMNAALVLEKIGAPDFAWATGNFGSPAPDPRFAAYQKESARAANWDYDMDTDDPYSMRIHWTEGCVVDRVEIIRPPLWTGQERDQALCQW